MSTGARHPFNAYLVERLLTRTAAIQELDGSVLGIDADKFLQDVLTQFVSKDALQAVTGSVSVRATELLAKAFDALEQRNITPIFVLSGLSCAADQPPSPTTTIRDLDPDSRIYVPAATRVARVAAGWDSYEHGRLDLASEQWSTCAPCDPPFEGLLRHMLSRRSIDFFVAPYKAAGQLASFLEDGTIDAVYGFAETVAWGAARVITRVDTDKNLFHWIDAELMREDVGLTEEQLQDVILLCGSQVTPRFPALGTLGYGDGTAAWKACVDFVRTYRSGALAVLAFGDDALTRQSDYYAAFCRGKSCVLHMPCMTQSGSVEPRRRATAPRDMHEFIGIRFPDEVYYLLARGVISRDSLEALSHGVYALRVPIDHGDAPETFVRNIRDTIDMRVHALNFLSQPLQYFYQNKPVRAQPWFASDEIAMVHKLSPSQHELVASWCLDEAVLRTLLGPGAGAAAAAPRLQGLLEGLRDDAARNLTISSSKHAPARNSLRAPQTYATVWFRLLQSRQFLDASSHALTDWGDALSHALNQLDGTRSLDLPMYLVFEVLRNGILCSLPAMYREDVQVPDMESLRLVARICVFVPALRCNPHDGPVMWPSTLDRNLSLFAAYVEAYYRSAEELFSMILLSLYLHSFPQRSEEELRWLRNTNPFDFTVGSCSGMLMQQFLYELDQHPGDVDRVRHKMGDKFSSVVAGDPTELIDSCLAFWDAAYSGIRRAAEQPGTLGRAELDRFASANTWLDRLRGRQP